MKTYYYTKHYTVGPLAGTARETAAMFIDFDAFLNWAYLVNKAHAVGGAEYYAESDHVLIG